jgi:hypothetical protein
VVFHVATMLIRTVNASLRHHLRNPCADDSSLGLSKLATSHAARTL